MGSINPNSENALENETIKTLFGQSCLNWETANCYHENPDKNNPVGRESQQEVILINRLRIALERLNPSLPPVAIEDAIKELKRDRGAMSDVKANREIYQLLKDGIQVRFSDTKGKERIEKVKVIDWKNPENNDFFLTSQFWIQGDVYRCRTDLLGFVNGLPLVLIELKTHYKNLKQAYTENITKYRGTNKVAGVIRKLFWYNAFIILSNGTQAVIGSTTAQWEHFNTWKWVSDGNKLIPATGEIQLETMLRGTCDKTQLLDIIENFTLFTEGNQGLIKLVGKCHQYLGVNNAIAAVEEIQTRQGKLGVFWHTQGSGKSYSMQFFTQKIARKISNAYKFVIVSDRNDLDDQIYNYFANTGVVIELEEQIRAKDGEHLKKLLREDHRYVFTTIQLFHTKKGGTYDTISDSDKIIVIVDEAHRSQYDTYAQNMRSALSHASFIGFTGTPLIDGEDQETKRVFGSYVSIYNFKQSIDDGATVRLYYENRVPEVLLTNDQLNDDIIRIIEENDLDDEQERKLSQRFVNEYTIITDSDRLNTIAKDIVTHFMTRGYQGKAMVVSIDRFTAVKMYNLVQQQWQNYLENLKAQSQDINISEFELKQLSKKIQYMEATDMAVVVSQSADEAVAFQEEGLDIISHRQRLNNEDLEGHFKDPDYPLRIVFVCAMWMTGFDVPSCSTIYLDKPMKNHTLMQAITRANRVFGDKKNNGLIVDYIGIFRNLRNALKIYGSSSDDRIQEGEWPVESKQELLNLIRQTISNTRKFCIDRGVDIYALLQQNDLFQYLNASHEAAMQLSGAKVLESVDDSIEKIIVNDNLKQEYLTLASHVKRLYKAILPDPQANEFTKEKTIFTVLADKIRSFQEETDISDIEEDVKELLDESITSVEYVIRESQPSDLIDISQLDIQAIETAQNNFNNSNYQRQELEKLKAAINRQLKPMIRRNKQRVNYQERFQQMIDEYNANSHNTAQLFQELLKFAQELSEESQRAIAKGLTEEELAIFDLLIKPDMTDEEEQKIKEITQQLLIDLRDKLCFEWNQKQETRDRVMESIYDQLNRLPETYSNELYDKMCAGVYRHIYESYYGNGKSVYSTV